MPKVSVLTPIYNTDLKQLRECIESVLNQTFSDFEFLILNDSPDNVEIEKLVKSYKDDRIKYYKNDKNIGISESRNKLLDLASGEYIAILDHDDICLPDRLALEVQYLDENEHVGVVSSWLQLFGDKKRLFKYPETDTEIRILMTETCAVAHTAAMIRKSVLVENNIYYETQFSPAEDYMMWYRLMFVTNFYNIQKPLVLYRWYNNQTSQKRAKEIFNQGQRIKYLVCNSFYAYRRGYEEKVRRIRVKLFGFIPFIKYKNNTVLLFDFIPVLKIKK